MKIRFKIPLIVVALLTACAQPVFNPQGTAPGLTPEYAAARIQAVAGERVIWGGVLVKVSNLARSTELEILAYPLDRRQRPQRDDRPQGRFIARYPGYLEPVTYAPGRLVTVLGRVEGLDTRKVGEAPYTYPMVATESVHLWDPEKPGSDVHFGVGIGIIGD